MKPQGSGWIYKNIWNHHPANIQHQTKYPRSNTCDENHTAIGFFHPILPGLTGQTNGDLRGAQPPLRWQSRWDGSFLGPPAPDFHENRWKNAKGETRPQKIICCWWIQIVDRYIWIDSIYNFLASICFSYLKYTDYRFLSSLWVIDLQQM